LLLRNRIPNHGFIEVQGNFCALFKVYRTAIELYNTTDKAVDIEGAYITDSIGMPLKSQITKGESAAQTIIPAHGYKVVWCDGAASADGELHADITLNAQAGFVRIASADGSWIDTLTYSMHDGNSTFGRYPDGTDHIYLLTTPTIERTNMLSYYAKTFDEVREMASAIETPYILASANGMRIYPRDANLVVKSYDAKSAIVQIYAVNGEIVLAKHVEFDDSGTAIISLSDLRQGIYVAKVENENNIVVACKVALCTQ